MFSTTTPAGRCPHKLEGTDLDSVVEWIKKLQETLPDSVLAPSAYRYWIRDTYDINGPDFKAAAASLKEIMG